jgi:TolB protein
MPSHFPVYTMGAFGNNRKRLFDFPIGSFAWSPDGQKLLFVSAYEDPEHNDPAVLRGKRAPLSAVYLLDFKTGEQKRLTSFGQHCSGAFSPDNAQVALSFGDEKKSDIYVLSLDGMHARRLTDSAIINIQPAWSPDGKSLAYVAVSPSGTEGPESGVFVVENNGSKKRKAGDMTAFGVAWSPDGKLLLLESAEGFKLVDPAGVTTRDLALGAGRMLDAVFTPDGREVMFRSDHEGYWYIYARNLVSSKIRRVSGNLTASSFCLSPLLSKD